METNEKRIGARGEVRGASKVCKRYNTYEDMWRKKQSSQSVHMMWKARSFYFFNFFIKSLRMICFLTLSLPSIYSQECLCWADTSQRAALPCPALPCSVLPDKVCSFGGTYDWFLPGATGTNDITDSWYLFLFAPPPFFLGLRPSVCLCCSFRSRSSSLPSCIVWSSMFVLRVYVTFKGVRCTAVGRKLLASFQRFHTKATVHMQPGENGKQYHKMSMEKSTQ